VPGEERRRKKESHPTETVEALLLCFARFGKTVQAGSPVISKSGLAHSREAEFVTLYR
jgi:hypothetical protein